MRMSCCSFINACVKLNRCVYRSKGFEGEYIGHQKVFECSFGRQYFIDKDEAFRSCFQGSEQEEEVHIWPAFIQDPELDQKAFEGAHEVTKQLSSSGVRLEGCESVGIYVSGEEFFVKNKRIIEQRENLQLVTWTYKDKSYYGFELYDNMMLEFYVPTPKLNGHALRSSVIMKFRTLNIQELCTSSIPRVAMSFEDVEVGQIICYKPKQNLTDYSKIVHVSKNLVRAKSYRGSESIWLSKLLEEKMLSNIIQIIALENVPTEDVRTLLEAIHYV